MKRYHTTGTSINGYWAIYDKENEDDTIWVDCSKKQLKIIVEALNKNETIS